MIVTFRKKKYLCDHNIYAIDLHSDYIVFLYVEDDVFFLKNISYINRSRILTHALF